MPSILFLNRVKAVLLLAAAAFILSACGVTTESVELASQDNGAPSGAHYNLNIIGVPHDKTADMDATNDNGIGNRIFVQLNYDDGSQHGKKFDDISKINKILLQPGADFAVLDANATDKDGASFQLPTDVSYTYEVYARPLGTPGGQAKLTTCATVTIDPDSEITGDEYEEVVCSTENHVAMREKGKSSFENVTDKLLYLSIMIDPELDTELATCFGITDTVDVDDGPVEVTAPLFDGCLENYFWDYDNNGLKLLQLRFYPATSN